MDCRTRAKHICKHARLIFVYCVRCCGGLCLVSESIWSLGFLLYSMVIDYFYHFFLSIIIIVYCTKTSLILFHSCLSIEFFSYYPSIFHSFFFYRFSDTIIFQYAYVISVHTFLYYNFNQFIRLAIFNTLVILLIQKFIFQSLWLLITYNKLFHTFISNKH